MISVGLKVVPGSNKLMSQFLDILHSFKFFQHNSLDFCLPSKPEKIDWFFLSR